MKFSISSNLDGIASSKVFPQLKQRRHSVLIVHWDITADIVMTWANYTLVIIIVMIMAFIVLCHDSS